MAARIAAALLSARPIEAQSSAQLARVDSSLSALTTNGFSGVVLLATNGSIVFNRAYGMANRAASIPMSTSSVVQIGSNTKDFTIVAILQLIEKGSLDMRDSLGKFFPEAPAEKRGITIDQLLHHTAGFGQQVGGDFEPVDRGEMVANAFRSRLIAKPGERRSYSNTGFNLLAAVIEKVAGTSYDQYVRDRILSPLGLHDTGFLLPAFDPKRYVHGYRDGEDMGAMLDKPHAADGPFWNLRGSGGMLSTSSDMFAFYRALFSTERLIKTASRDLVFGRSGPRFLAGSDLVHFFVYGAEPDGTESIIALNTMAVDPQRVRGIIDAALGKTAPNAAGGPQRVITGGPPGTAGPTDRDGRRTVRDADDERRACGPGLRSRLQPGPRRRDALVPVDVSRTHRTHDRRARRELRDDPPKPRLHHTCIARDIIGYVRDDRVQLRARGTDHDDLLGGIDGTVSADWHSDRDRRSPPTP